MAIITKPTISKGQANEFDLSKSDLAAVSKVVNDSYFSDQANWSKVAMEYESDTGEQIEMLIFDASQESPKANFEVSEKAKDNWQVKSVIIMDFDGGYLKLGRGDLTVEEFDIALGDVGGDITMLFSNSLHHPNVTISSDQLTATFSNYGHALSDNTEVFSGQKFYAEFVIDENVIIATVGFSFYDTIPDVNDGNRYTSNVKLSVSLGQNGDLIYGNKSSNTFVSSNFRWSFNAGDTVGIAIDTATQEIYVRRNGSWLSYYSNTNPSDPENGIDGRSYAGYGNAENGDTVYLDVFAREGSVTLVSDPADIPTGYKLLGS